MEDLFKLLIILAVPFVVCQDSPDTIVKASRCHISGDLLYSQCCVFPPFFTRDVARGCGALFEMLSPNAATNSSSIRRIAYDTCRFWKCLLKTYDFMDEDGYADYVRYFAHLDKWVELNPQFGTVMPNAKIHCKQLFAMDLPLEPCRFHNFHRCIRHYIDVFCPVVVSTELCKKRKEIYEECSEYFI